MNRLLGLLLRPLNRVLLYAASMRLPRGDRAEWRREWLAELWQVERSPLPPGKKSLAEFFTPTRFCLGAFPDVRALCCSRVVFRAKSLYVDRSAWTCLMTLGAILWISFTAAQLLPGSIEARHARRFQVRPDLVLIRHADVRGSQAAAISVALYRQLERAHQSGFDGFAYYRIENAPLKAQSAGSIVHASANLFTLLGLHAALSDAQNGQERIDSSRRIVLSDTTWRKQFGADPRIIGREIRVGGYSARVSAVMPPGAWRLPGTPGAWLLESDASLETGGDGCVVGHLSQIGSTEMWAGYVPISLFNADGDAIDLCGISFDERTCGSWGVYLFAMLLVLLSLPAVIVVSREDLPFSTQKASRERVLLRYAFLLIKSAMVVGIAYYLSFDLAFGWTTGYQPKAHETLFFFSLAIGLFGMRWAILDQQRRCPICLRKVTHPARVGMASRTFLAWNGTEMICTGGHTLLYVPSLPTSWFNAPRWVYLDSSWSFLFFE